MTQSLKQSLSRENIGCSFINFPSGYWQYPGLGAGDPQRMPALTQLTVYQRHVQEATYNT